MENEIWKSVRGYEGLYEVSNLGRVRSLPRLVKNGTGGKFYSKFKIMNKHSDTSGYNTIALSKENIMTKTRLHRIIAEAFIHNPDNKDFVNHKNSNRKDNRISNLEWVTAGENLKHCYDSGRRKKRYAPMKGKFGNTNYIPKAIIQKSIDGSEIARFRSMTEASKITGIPVSSISSACKKRRLTSNGFVWDYQ